MLSRWLDAQNPMKDSLRRERAVVDEDFHFPVPVSLILFPPPQDREAAIYSSVPRRMSNATMK